MARLFFASLVTFGLLIGMVVGVVLAAMVSPGEVNLALAIGLTIAINARDLADQPVARRTSRSAGSTSSNFSTTRP